MQDDRALPRLHEDDALTGASEVTPVCSRVLPTADKDGDLRINDAFFASHHEPDTDVRVNVALLAASGERPALRAEPVAEARPDAAASAAQELAMHTNTASRGKLVALTCAAAVIVAAIAVAVRLFA